MQIASVVAFLGLAGLIVAIVAETLGSRLLASIGVLVCAVCCAVLFVRAALRREEASASDFEVGAEEKPVAPFAAEQELKRQDRGTIRRQQ